MALYMKSIKAGLEAATLADAQATAWERDADAQEAKAAWHDAEARAAMAWNAWYDAGGRPIMVTSVANIRMKALIARDTARKYRENAGRSKKEARALWEQLIYETGQGEAG